MIECDDVPDSLRLLATWLRQLELAALALARAGLPAARRRTVGDCAQAVGPPAMPAGSAAGGKRPAAPRRTPPRRVRGKVVWLDEALERLYGVTTEPDAAETAVVLEMADGQLLPIVPDTRGRAFAVDERLRNVELELLVRRYAEVPMIQVIRVFATTPDGLYEIDYWCDICAIPMYILKPCECCQGPTRLRERKSSRAQP